MDTQRFDVREQAKSILQKLINKRSDNFLHDMVAFFRNGKLDHNHIRKAIISCCRSAGDKRAMLLGALLLQLDNEEIQELMKDNLTFN